VELTGEEAEMVLPTDKPVIFVDKTRRNQHMKALVSREALLREHAQVQVLLSSSNTYSHGKQQMSLEQYIQSIVDVPLAPNALSNDTYYLFGGIEHEAPWSDFANAYTYPPSCSRCREIGTKTIGLGGAQSGTGFHLHGAAFSEPIVGRKRWFILPPGFSAGLGFHPNMTVSAWAKQLDERRELGQQHHLKSASMIVKKKKKTKLSVEEKEEQEEEEEKEVLSKEDDEDDEGEEQQQEEQMDRLLYDCVVSPGELLYFPDQFLHATLNLDAYNFFVSIFV